jgi:hypothetical protein
MESPRHGVPRAYVAGLIVGVLVCVFYVEAYVATGFTLEWDGWRTYLLYGVAPLAEVVGIIAVVYLSRRRASSRARVVRDMAVAAWIVAFVNLAVTFTGVFGFM